ncbi:MAG: YerC/YecD family TrpR-related protein, partial [Patescibacteria group bacterium]
MENLLNNKSVDELCGAFLNLKNKRECRKFLRDLCTIEEIKSIAERLQVAKQVNKGISYRMIAEKTGSSTATITRVAHWLHHGEGGYQLLLHRL